ncbi:Hypothetical_protein [Hexamita inflata]|uniref:Hypothetical_protein n=1 Tax=Hexamita inflata TaxID=28002 RepID=A0AA86NXA2_9EUKA|nr:Hypothetical protein HINF_LOCUS15244 [Hexamita inflata]
MCKFKDTEKKHDDKKITLKTNNVEAQSENEKKLKQVRKLNLRGIRQIKRSRKPKSSEKSPQKETQKKKEDKQPVQGNPIKSQPKDGPNEQKTITDTKYETKPIQRKPRRSSKWNIRNSLSNKEDINSSKPLEIAHPSPAIYPKIRNMQKQINQNGPQVPNQVNETMHQRQPSSNNTNTMNQPLVQAEENNEQRETEKREPVSGNQVSESGETGPLMTQ